MKKNRIILIVIGVLLVFNLILFKDRIFNDVNDQLEEVDTSNFKGIENLKFLGKVTKVKEQLGHFHGMGILQVNMVKSNIEYYDPRKKQANYYCIIKDTIAEFYVKGVSDIKPNDTIYVDISKEKSEVFNLSRDFARRLSLMVYPRSFFDYIKRKEYQDL
ncbi:hypothetical protein [Mesonia sp. K4-1]|uniref:hypothetical protein n=1 Tax=Mesonia sp. K4-1 TaxID=2602760 RepID=UPI0011CB34C4|nr:hypothetical protein [Mesonia sp. K4-1]TXK74419.1 hypothetical protein FT986_11535 [Mesonia sp. K4-1]